MNKDNVHEVNMKTNEHDIEFPAKQNRKSDLWNAYAPSQCSINYGKK